MTANTAPMSMVNPSTDALMKRIDSRYSLVVLAAKRARQILAKSPVRSTGERSVKDVTNALEEILEGKINYVPGIIEAPEEAAASDEDEGAAATVAGKDERQRAERASGQEEESRFDYESDGGYSEDVSDIVVDVGKQSKR